MSLLLVAVVVAVVTLFVWRIMSSGVKWDPRGQVCAGFDRTRIDSVLKSFQILSALLRDWGIFRAWACPRHPSDKTRS